MHYKNICRHSVGYAIIYVIILLVIASGVILLFSKESAFLNKVTGFFSRTHQIESFAESGLDLAEIDLLNITTNVKSNRQDQELFVPLTGNIQAALDQGLHTFNAAPRTIVPKFTRQNGNFQLDVFYFPLNPCQTIPCATPTDYNSRFPKIFNIVSQATNLSTNEVYSVETRAIIRFENFTEISYGISGVMPFPNITTYDFDPATYGRAHFNLPYDPSKPLRDIKRVRFRSDGFLRSDHTSQELIVNADDNTHVFLGPVSFQSPAFLEDGQSGLELPFEREVGSEEGGVTLSSEVQFHEGYEVDVEIFHDELLPNGDPNPDYKAQFDPVSSQSFESYQALASSGQGVDFSSSTSCKFNPVTRKQEKHVCLKMNGEEVLEYACNNAWDPTDTVTGPENPDGLGSFFMQPSVDAVTWADAPDVLTKIDAFPDRYVGERAHVKNGTVDTSQSAHNINGIFYCQDDGCPCNIHVKGIYKGNINVVADNVVIEGDIVNGNQDPVSSAYIFGATAKDNIIIPEGVPQAANSDSNEDSSIQRSDTTASQPPFDVASTTNCQPNTPCNPSTLAESYLNITNFIASDDDGYVDRDNEDPNALYLETASWLNAFDTPEHDQDGDGLPDYYNSPMALDLDGHFFAGDTVVLDGIANPEYVANPNGATATVVLTCENEACTKFKYREPSYDSDPFDQAWDMANGTKVENPMYTYDIGAGLDDLSDDTQSFFVNEDGFRVRPVFYADGLNKNGVIPAQNDSSPIDVTSQYDHQLSFKEDMPRMNNELLHIFGSINAKYFQINGSKSKHKIGFREKIITGDPRASSMVPPGMPSTENIIYNELFRKSYMGISPLLQNAAPPVDDPNEDSQDSDSDLL